MNYLTRAQPEVNESHIHGLIFHTGEVSELWRKTLINMFFFVVLAWKPVFQSQKLTQQTSKKGFSNAILLF